ncbi:MAG: PBP1A family penicillin-binding protein [Bacillota bacterium]|nr:PBP1A family penicillin-binding protein [Bacillota bacterium]MDW7730527.1 PBP1A family penicillin-binding protein [Bacillota bacterium]
MAEKKTPLDLKTKKPAVNKKNKRRLSASIIKGFFVLLIVLFLIGGGAAAAVVVNFVNDAPPLDPSRLATVETSYIYDSYGEEIVALHEEQNRILVVLNEIPDHVQQAFIAVEDERFLSHFGFDIIGSLRAAYANFRAGEIVQGASTITQQLAQNAFLTSETTYKRKIQEIWLALQLERSYGKEEILEMYLNRIYFGNGAYGVEAAAQTYFDKSIGEVNVAEAAMLAGAVRSPNIYNPIDNEIEAAGRMQLVLSSMKRLGLISDSQHRQALIYQFEYAEAKSPDYPYPHFVDYVVHYDLIRILSEIPGIGSREEAYKAIYTGGLRIYTTLEPSLQTHVEEVLSRTDLYPSTILVDMPKVREAIAELPAGRDLTRAQLLDLVDEEGGIPQPQAAIVVADPATGKIKALGGGREYRKKFDEILRFTTLRQPGSAIKPIITYAPAIEEGVLAGAGSPLDDSPFTGPQGWRPKNFDNRFRGLISAREALYYSYNVPAVRAFQALGPRVGVGYAERMGISTIDPGEIDNLALTLGGFTYGVSAVDMAQAYGVLANEGVRVDLHTVEKIVDRHGVVIYEERINPKQVLSPQTTFIINDILQDFVRVYLGRALQIDRPVAAKTGTTENWKDVYLVAYTPNLVASFWMGFDEPKMGGIQQGWRYSTAFLREVFLEAFKELEKKDFLRPDGIVRMEVCSLSGLRPTEICRAAGTVLSDYFVAKYAPRITCDLHLELLPDLDDLDDENGDEQPDEPVEEPPAEEPPAEEPPPDNGSDPEDPGDEDPPADPPGNGGDNGQGGNGDQPPNWWENF